MIRGNAKFDGLAVGEGKFSFMGPTVHLDGKAAFVNSRTGDTHGWTNNTQWSPETIAKLSELRALMEVDLGRLHMENGGEVLIGPTNTGGVGVSSVGGLGEHIGREPTPQV